MNSLKRSIVVAQLLAIFPAALFMGSLVVRELQPIQNEPAHTAQQIVMWYAGRMWTLWLLLISLPLLVLVMGGANLAQKWRGQAKPAAQRKPPATPADRAIVAMTAMAAVILAIVGLHMGAN